MQYCERCLEKFYDEEIVVLQKGKGDWMCPLCRGICCCSACDPQKSKAKVVSLSIHYELESYVATYLPLDAE